MLIQAQTKFTSPNGKVYTGTSANLKIEYYTKFDAAISVNVNNTVAVVSTQLNQRANATLDSDIAIIFSGPYSFDAPLSANSIRDTLSLPILRSHGNNITYALTPGSIATPNDGVLNTSNNIDFILYDAYLFTGVYLTLGTIMGTICRLKVRGGRSPTTVELRLKYLSGFTPWKTMTRLAVNGDIHTYGRSIHVNGYPTEDNMYNEFLGIASTIKLGRVLGFEVRSLT